MILEVCSIQVKQGLEGEYEEALKKASMFIAQAKGYIHHDLQRCHEVQGKYILLVQWESVEDHTIGFRQSNLYEQWRTMLHPYYENISVEHFHQVNLLSNQSKL